LLVDDHEIVRDGLKRIINDSPNLEVKAEANDGIEAIQHLSNSVFDLVILDISMPGKNGIEVLKESKSIHPKIPVLMLSMHEEKQYAIRSFRAGASGYLTKDIASKELVKAILHIMDGHKYINPQVAEVLATSLDKNVEKPLHSFLSDREYEVMIQIASGFSITDISKRLSLSDKTISTYRTRILKKMNFKNNSELTHYAISQKLTD
jgi:DNA-binding NarL/FixJ family response regulator